METATSQLEADAAQASSCRDIFEAAEKGKLGGLRHLLRETPSLVEMKDAYGDEPLHVALQNREAQAAQLLLAARADVDAKGYQGLTPLHAAAANGQTEAMQRLLEARAAVDAVDKERSRPLHLAAGNGRTSALQQLLAAGATISAADSRGATALDAAVSNGHAEAARQLRKAGEWSSPTALHLAAALGEAQVADLLAAGAELNATDCLGRTPLHAAATNGQTEAMQRLLEARAAVDAVDKERRRPLHLAAEFGHGGAAQVLLEAGGAVEAKDNSGRTPLHRAARYGHGAEAQVLLDAGASVEATDNSGATPLHLAAEKGHGAAAQVLLDAGASMEATVDNGLTPLQLATINGHGAAVQVLLLAGASMEAKDSGMMPLHYAAWRGGAAAVLGLLEAKASVEATDSMGATPLHWAAERGHGAAAQVLLKAGAPMEVAGDLRGATPLHWAAERGHCAAAQVLLKAGASVKATVNNGQAPLHLAAECGQSAVARVFLDAGASVEAKDHRGATPLHLAARNGHGAAAQVLLDAKSSIEVRNDDGMTPLHLAAFNGHGAAVQVLLDAGASVEATENRGWTPLHLAAENCQSAVAQVLLDAGAAAEATDDRGQTPLDVALAKGHGRLRRVLQPVRVTLLSGRSAKCDSSGDRTVQALIEDAQIELGVRISHLVTPAGETLKPSSTLGELGLEKGGEVTGIIMQEEAESHEVAVSTKSGRTVACKATADTTIQEILYEAQQKLGLEILHLAMPAGQVLSPQSLLSDADLDNENRLTAILAQDGQDEIEGCSLDDPQSLIDFVISADIGLIRLEFLIELQASGEVLPRRQEAESARTASGVSALVQRDELRSLRVDSIGRVRQGTDLVQFLSISHAWECREHPDPHGFQLGQIVGTLLLGNMNAGVTWVFYDYSSLFQYKRRTQREEDSFRRAMQGMHQLYANEIVNVLIVDSLTPSENRTRTHVVTYFEEEDRVVRRPIEDLIGNNTPYGDRGWCRAEREWSRLRADLAGGVPTPPDLFARWINSMVFTHRSDAQAVIDLQRQVFEEKVATARNLLVKDLGQAELQALRGALPHYKRLENVVIIGSPLRSLDAIAAVETGATEIQMTSCGLGDEAAVALASAVRERSKQPETINLARNRIGQVGQEALKTLMQEIPRLKIDMSEQDEVQALESSPTARLAGPAGSALRKAKPQGLGQSG